MTELRLKKLKDAENQVFLRHPFKCLRLDSVSLHSKRVWLGVFFFFFLFFFLLSNCL